MKRRTPQKERGDSHTDGKRKREKEILIDI